MAIEEHNIWILHNQELMPLYEPDQERLDKIAITGENFKQVTKDLDKPYEETKEEYKKTLITSINVMYNIVIELKLDDILGLSTEELKNALLSIENSNLYILSQEELNNEGIKDVSINNNEFYVVDYNSGEVFYSLGINGKYKLSEIQ